MVKILITLASTIGEILGIRIGRFFDHCINHEEPGLIVGIIRQMVEQTRVKPPTPAAT